MYCYSQKNNIYSDVYEKWFIGTKTTAELKQYLVILPNGKFFPR